MTTYKEIFGKPIKVLTADPAPTPVSITVTAAGGAYYIDGVLQKTLELYEGNTYIFTYPSAHPFRFATAADAAGSSEYTTGVTVDSSTQITIVVASGAPNLFYYCTNHNNMGGTILTPASPSEYEGQIWYNETTGKFRSIISTSAWSSGSALNTGRYSAGGGGPQTAAIVAGGNLQSGTTATTELYNGSGWAVAPNMNTSRGGLGSSKDGSQTAHLVFGGSSNSTATESFNGSAWTTTPNSLNTGKDYTSGAGTSTAALNAGRWGPPMIGNTEEWNGSSWSEQNDLNTARGDMASFGSQTAAIFAGGNSGSPPNYRDLAEQYDGTSWTALPTLNTARGMGGSGAGSATSGLVFGGNKPGPSAANESESWDGSSWTATPSLAEAGSRSGNGASSNAGLAYGDYPVTGVTEEFTKSTNTITAAAWASGNNLNSARFQMAGAGTQTAGLAFSGYEPGGESGKTEEYNGTSWSEQNDMGTARYEAGNGNGTQTAALCSAGRTDTAHSGGAQAFVEEYDGTSWSEVNNLPGNRTAHGSAGPQTASIIALGKSAPPAPSVVTTSLHYDGTNWTSGGSTNTARFAAFGAGTQTSAIFAGGNPSLATAEEYNGSAWTTTGSLIAGAQGPSAAGVDSDAALFTSGGNGGSSSGVAETSSYNGTIFVSAPRLSSERGYAAGFGTQTSAVVAAGLRSSGVNTTEEFTGETSTANIQDFATS